MSAALAVLLVAVLAAALFCMTALVLVLDQLRETRDDLADLTEHLRCTSRAEAVDR